MAHTHPAGAPCCEFLAVHEDTVQRVRSLLPGEDDLYDLAELFKVFGDSTRVKILYVLFESELCVCDISTVVNISAFAVSHQLKILKNAGLVKYRRDGKTVFYSLSDSHVTTILSQGLEHISE